MFNTRSNHDSEAHMSELHVLGIGSPFGDDQLGWEVVKLLQRRPTLYHYTQEQLHMACSDRPGMHLLELMRPAQTVFLIDAIKTGAALGTLHRFQNKEIEGIGDTLSTHALGISEAMKIGASLQILPQKIILYGVEIGDVLFQFELSESIKQTINALSVRVESDILSALNGPSLNPSKAS
ncbi:MAG: hydrogenase maturation protease [Legionellales bacterium]|nr:hydrogenase maturation protease [Legionellales bacterium]